MLLIIEAIYSSERLAEFTRSRHAQCPCSIAVSSKKLCTEALANMEKIKGNQSVINSVHEIK